MKEQNVSLIDVIRSERTFFDKCYEDADKEQEKSGYLMPDELVRQVMYPDPRPLKDIEYAYSRLGGLEGKKILDYGAGDGWNTVCFAKAKAKVWSIDISEKGIELIRKKAIANGVEAAVCAHVGDCYKTPFPSNEFDIVYGGGVLHHLNIDMAVREVNRVLRHDGIAVFYEPIRDTKVMDFFKKIILKILRKEPLKETENETPLNSDKLELLRTYFKIVNYRYFNVLTSIGLILDYEGLKWFLRWADFVLMETIPGFKKLGRAVVVELREPIKTQTQNLEEGNNSAL